jgi:hypothetical protein
MPLDQVPEDGRARVVEKKIWRLRSLFETDLRKAFEYLDDLRTHEAWKYIREPDMQRLVENRCRVTPAFVEQLRSGYASLVAAGHTGKITKTQAIRQRRESQPAETQQQTADAVGCSERFVREIVNNRNTTSQSEQVVPVPDWLTNPNQQAAFRKLPADERARLEGLPDDQRRGSVRQAAIAAGIVKVPGVLDQMRKLWAKASEADRRTFMEEIKDGR